jgi:hypothetical protein
MALSLILSGLIAEYVINGFCYGHEFVEPDTSNTNQKVLLRFIGKDK